MKKHLTPFVLCALLLVGCGQNIEIPLLDIGFEEEAATKEDKDPPQKHVATLLQSTGSVHYGMDISHFQGNIMDAINSTDSLKFVICKATEGTGFQDPMFRSNWSKIKENAIKTIFNTTSS